MTQHHLRLPPALHERLKEIAEEQGVSLNHAIVMVLCTATGVDFKPKEEEARGDPESRRLA